MRTTKEGGLIFLVLGTIGFLFTLGAMFAYGEKESMKAYPQLDKKAFDEHNAVHGVDTSQILPIAARNGVTPNKWGILPRHGWGKCYDYVKQYANDIKDVAEFENVWNKYVDYQEEVVRKNLMNPQVNPELKNFQLGKEWRKESRKKYKDPYNSIVLQIEHWNDITLKEHKKRLKALMNTEFKYYTKRKPILRPIPNTGRYLEVIECVGWNRFDHESLNKGDIEIIYDQCCMECGFLSELFKPDKKVIIACKFRG